MEQHRILLVEDDPNLGTVLQEYMSLKGYTVELCCDGEAAWEVFQTSNSGFDLCIVDVMMPKQDGFTLARSIRAKDERVPIVFVTAKSMQADKMEGFHIGADDYITKPFSIEELMMRIQAILRRTKQATQTPQKFPDEFHLGEYVFNYPNQTLRHPEHVTQLTGKEADLLQLLCQCQFTNQVMKREIALKTIWGDDSYFNGRSMDVFITKLRKHLKLDPAVEIVNVHGSGYKLFIR
jgi:DNA-binding response OmpR family regulator